jgi:hypothetical protein
MFACNAGLGLGFQMLSSTRTIAARVFPGACSGVSCVATLGLTRRRAPETGFLGPPFRLPSSIRPFDPVDHLALRAALPPSISGQ